MSTSAHSVFVPHAATQEQPGFRPARGRASVTELAPAV